MSTLKRAYRNGYRTALSKFALETPNPADEFVANVESGKDVLPDPEPSELTMPLPVEDPSTDDFGMSVQSNSEQSVDDMPKSAAIGLADVLNLENMMGKEDAHSMFNSLDRQMSGMDRGRSGTLQITPQGTQMQPRSMPPLPPHMRMPSPAPNLGAQAAQHVMTSAPRFMPR